MYLSIYLPICLSIYLSIYISLSIYLSIYLPTYLSIYLFVCMSVCLPASLKTPHFCETSSIFGFDNVKNETILRDVLNFWTQQREKRNNSARLLHFSNLTTQTGSNSARLLQKWKVACSADSLVPMRFAIFPLHLSKLLHLPRKSDARSYEVLHLSRKIISANLKIWGSKMQPLSGNKRPDLLTALMNMSLVLRLPRKMDLCRSSSNVPRLPSFLAMLQKPSRFAHFWQGAQSLAPATQNDIWTSKSAPYPSVFTLLTSKCASRQNGMHFFDISISKSGPSMVFCTFWLRNVLRATTACTFSTSQLLKVLRGWGVLYIWTWKCAIFHLSSG